MLPLVANISYYEMPFCELFESLSVKISPAQLYAYCKELIRSKLLRLASWFPFYVSVVSFEKRKDSLLVFVYDVYKFPSRRILFMNKAEKLAIYR